MSNQNRLSCSIALIPSLVILAVGCAPVRPQHFATPFLPPAPAGPSAGIVIADPPEVIPNLYLKETPSQVLAALERRVRSTEVQTHILRAEDRFQAGKALRERGDLDAARGEFDRAIDILLSAPKGDADRHELNRKYERLVEAIYSYDVEEQRAPDSEPVYDKSPLDEILEMTFPVDPKLKPRLREQIQATVSQLPLEENDAVLGYINYFSTLRGRKTLAAGLRRAGRYRPLIHRILDEEGIPRELIFLAQAESGFLPRAVSRKRATGMWQFVQYRGREYGLRQTRDTDDRLDPEKATRAAARHLRDLYEQFGDWYLAMAAYNCGPGRVAGAVERTGYADFWELRRRKVLPRETANYLPIILAMTIMAKNPGDYGLEAVEPELPLEYNTVELPSAVHLALISDITDRPLSEIRDLNPAVLRSVAPAGYPIRLPKGTASAVVAALEAIPADRRATWRLHRVQSGQTLHQIALRYGTSAGSIASANPGSVDLKEAPEAGDLLVVPVSYRASAKAPAPRARRAPLRSKPVARKAASRPPAKTISGAKTTASLRGFERARNRQQP